MSNLPGTRLTMDDKIRIKVRELAILLQIHDESNDLFEVSVDHDEIMSIKIDLRKI